MDTSFITINKHSSIRLDGGEGKAIYIDPFGFEVEPHDADLVLVTHSHYDHLSPEDIARVTRTSTHFVTPAGVASDLMSKGIPTERITFLLPGESCEPLPGIRIEAVPAYNIEDPFHPKENGWLGFIVTMPDETRVYIAGDTDDLPENRSIACDIALVPVGGTYTMDAAEAAAFVNALHPQAVIPEHYGSIVGTPEDGKAFAKLVDPSIEVVFKL